MQRLLARLLAQRPPPAAHDGSARVMALLEEFFTQNGV
jgi:hypothetical protein